MTDLNQFAESEKVMQDQLKKSSSKVSEISENLTALDSIHQNNEEQLNSLLVQADDVLASIKEGDVTFSSDEIDSLLASVNPEKIQADKVKLQRVEPINIEGVLTKDMTWEEYMGSVRNYAHLNNINLEDPFEGLLSPSQKSTLLNRIQEDFTYKNAQCDVYDYLIAGSSGVLCGLIDIVFVGSPGDSVLGEKVDGYANSATEKFASFLGWDKEKAIEKGSDSTASAIGFLERKFKINYDQATTHSVSGQVSNLSLKNHHVKSLGHSPDIIGLFFSILNQFTDTSSFVSNGQIITVDTETFELQGHNFVAKIFSGFVNWFGHIMSDWTGSSGTVGQGRRGTGVPMPFYNLFLMMDVGEFGQHKQSFATIATKVFEQGYDFRHGMAMAIPVLINELLIRFCYTIKRKFYHNLSWKDSIPSADMPEMRRMLLVGHGVLCVIDGVDAYVKGVGNPVAVLKNTNLIGWVRFSHLGLKELNALIKQGKIDHKKIDQHLDDEFKQLYFKMNNSYKH
jgi:hypothetical protein